jgi:anti-anti-sigma factor
MTDSPSTDDYSPDNPSPDNYGPNDLEAALTVVRELQPDAVVLVLRGELDITTLPAAQRGVEAAEREAPPAMVIDMSQLAFVDSSGVRLVLLAEENARVAGRRLAVRLGTGPARRVFAVLGLVDRLDVVDGSR